MSAKAKYAVIYRHREKYSVLVMCRFFSVSRSGYYSFVRRLNRPEKDASLAEKIRSQQDKCFHTYGYRRMWQWLKNSEEIIHNPKTILRVMKKYGLLSEIRRRRRWQQMGQQLHKYQNLLNRNFQAEAPNRKWGDRYLLYSNQTRCAVPVHDPGSVRQQHCSLQDCNPANSQPGSGYDPPGSAQRKEEGRRGVTAPQRPGVSVYLASVL